MLEGTTGNLYVCSVPNVRGGKPGEKHVSTRSVERAVSFAARWDRPGRAVYYSIGNIADGAPRNAESVVENTFVGTDVDPAPGEMAGAVEERLAALDCPPTRVHLSGRGVHALWRLSEPCTDAQRFNRLARLVHRLVGGDEGFTPHCAALMRLPDSHNTKDGAWTAVTVPVQSEARYDLEALEAWASTAAEAAGIASVNPYLEAAEAMGFRPPMDVERELGEMREGNIHDTQLRAAASLMSGGATEDEAVAVILAATRVVAPDGWDWDREERDVRRMCRDWDRKHGDEISERQSNVVSMRTRQRVNGTPEADAEGEPEGGAPRGKKSKKDKSVHVVLAKATLAAVRARGDDVMVVGEMVWRCNAGVWESLTPSAAKAWLDVEVETACRELKVPSATRVVNEARAWIVRNPDLAGRDVPWDRHRRVPTRSGLLDPLTRTIRPFSPQDYATYRVEAEYQPGAECPVWLRLLSDAFPGDAGAVSFLQEFLGASLLEHKSRSMTRALILIGPSNGGKSTVISALSGFLSATLNTTTFDALEGSHGGMGFLQRAPWVLHEAFDPNKWHLSSTVKAILSGDPINVNVKNGPILTRVFKSPVIWGANSPPQFREASRAIENRVKQLTVHRVFDPKAPVGVALEARQAGYDSPHEMVLDRERAGMLNWALDGLSRLTERGYFVDTEEMEKAARDMRWEHNPAVGFMEECIAFNPDKMVTKLDFLQAFTAWWIENKGEGRGKPSQEGLGRWMNQLYEGRVATDKTELIITGGFRCYAGIELNEVGLDLWSSAANELAVSGKGGRISDRADQVNRDIPASWIRKGSIRKMREAHKRSGAKRDEEGDE